MPRIGIVAPASPVWKKDRLPNAVAELERLGFSIEIDPGVEARDKRFCGTDEVRAAGLMRMCTDPAIDIVMAARGGYGTSRLLPQLDWDAIAARNPVVCGYSDITAFSLAYLARCGGISWQGPVAGEFEDRREYTTEHFLSAMRTGCVDATFDTDAPDFAAEGTLWGGNLSLVAHLVGTPWMPDIEGGILFVEDTHEHAYSVERMLLQLAYAGILGRQKAILAGRFSGTDPKLENGFTIADALSRISKVPGVPPIITGLPFGHVGGKLTLPVGAKAAVTVRDGKAHLTASGAPHLAGGAA